MLRHHRTTLAVLAVWMASLVLAQLNPVDPHAKAAYFVTNTTTGAEYVVAMNFVESTGDIYIHMSVDSSRSWVGVGIGDQMQGSLMIIAYTSENGTGVTASPRIATGHSEPELVGDGSMFEKIWTDEYAPNCNTATPIIMIAHGVCRNCSHLSTNKLDYTSKAQPFIFAVGPPAHLKDDSLDAPLRRHESFGRFTMDMTQATTPRDFSEGADYG
ncbi:hypothetical protein BAUCODRAFT_39862 [Baudoinia panamericana UAMH 10762]|uniref:DOMON domain-containing protein n=1 Tax=Baudoinia panamericana (strain UAMH 10762) TaxID=717646 RepID=M2M2U0_BAUPA|nr:uncharacterized protein BAUCODRAFT_39862 [Baudoinia panamericana UAMH 10762]EMC90846.1 hypothetical protein BAUCODRAFT_39862 [Baudoinia panamericana UAMH 10762]